MSLRDQLRDRMAGGYGDMATVLGGTVVRNLLRGVFKLVVAGALAPAAFGVLRAIFSVFKISTSLAELGIDHAVVTWVASARKRGTEAESERLLRTSLGLKLVAGLLVLIFGNLIARSVAMRVLGDADLTFYVRLAFAAVGGQLMWRFVSTSFSAKQQFRKLAGFLTTVPTLLLASAGVLLLLGRFSLTWGILLYLFTPTIAVLIWWPALGRRVLAWPLIESEPARRLIGFSRWVYATSGASTTRNHLNPILLKNPVFSSSLAAGEINAGLYGFGSDLAGEITIFTQSLLTVLLPKASSKSSGRKLKEFVRRSYLHVLLLMIPMILPMFMARPFIHALSHISARFLEYLSSAEVFAVLYLGNLTSLVSIPMQTALYALKRPQTVTLSEVLGLVVMIVGSVLMIPSLGVMGAAYAVVIQRAVSFLVLVVIGTMRLAQAGDGPLEDGR